VTAVTPSNRPVSSVVSWSAFLSPIAIFNLTLICFLVAGFAYYIAGVNAVASGEYNIASHRIQVAKLMEAQSSLVLEKSATENPLAALSFAQAKNMTEAKDAIYIFENNNVALQR
jgi:hypothetical protein